MNSNDITTLEIGEFNFDLPVSLEIDQPAVGIVARENVPQPTPPPQPPKPPQLPKPKQVVVAPAVNGPSYVMRGYWDEHIKIGQLLVTAHRFLRDAVMTLVDLHLPTVDTQSGKKSGKSSHRKYMGKQCKLPHTHYHLIMEIKMEHNGENRSYRMSKPQGNIVQDWAELDLSQIKLKATAEQRQLISDFLDIIYLGAEEAPARHLSRPDYNPRPVRVHHMPRPAPLGNLFERAGVSVEVKPIARV
jgi:hypothetical protein